MRYIWDWFIDLGRGRQSGLSSNPISWSDIKAWCWLMDVRIEPWEVDTLRQLDQCFLQSVAEKSKEKHA